MNLTKDNYYSDMANYEYMSVSQYKDFAGSYGRAGCEACAMARLRGEFYEPPTTAMQVGSYVDAYYEGTLDRFKEDNPSMFKRDGSLRSEFLKAEQMIARAERDQLFHAYMSGDKQVIMTGELFGVPWKIKMDSYHPGKAIVDLKCMATLTKQYFVPDTGYMDFVRYWGYDVQGAIYQEIVRQNTGQRLPFYIAGISKEDAIDIELIYVSDAYLHEALINVEANMPRILAVKSGQEQPARCESCRYCRDTKVLKRPTTIDALASKL